VPTSGKAAVSSDISECPRNPGVRRGKLWEASFPEYTEAHLSLLLTPLSENSVVNVENQVALGAADIVVPPTRGRGVILAEGGNIGR
jgi:hypothetical protein